MQLILRDKNQYILRLNKGEELIASLKKFCKKEKIRAAFFQGLGAALEGEVAFYNLAKKKYIKQRFKKPVEILNIVGNIGVLSRETIIHAHGLFSNRRMQVFGGHIDYLVIAATCEIFLIKFGGKIARKYSKEIGLNLMDPVRSLRI